MPTVRSTLKPNKFTLYQNKTLMPRTRVFKSGNSQAVRIPAEIAYAETDIDLEITRLGDVITIFPARKSLQDVIAALHRAHFSDIRGLSIENWVV